MLYKYASAARKTFLKDRLIRFSQPGVFNDPFELHPHYQLASKADIESLPPAPGQPEGPGPKMRQMTPEFLRGMLNAVLPGLARTASGMSAGGTYSLNSNLVARATFDEMYGILSMARVPDDLLMWAHYADCHRGFAIQFDESHAFFCEPHAEDHACRLADVDYSDVRPSLSFSNLRSPEVFLRKSTAWAYEREVRLIRPLGDATRVVPAAPPAFPICLFEVPADAVTGVVLGACMGESDQTEIHELLKSNPSLSHVKVFNMHLSPEKFELHVHPPLDGVPSRWGGAQVCEAR